MESNRHKVAIMQQQSAVDMLKTLVKNRRATSSDLDAAERRLAELKELDQQPSNEPDSLQKEVLPVKLEPAPQAEPTPDAMTIGRNLMKQIDDLKREIAEISNSMHLVPEDAACPELMQAALAKKKEEEALWTKYRFLKKNGHLPEVPEEEEEQRSLELLDAIDKKNKLIDKRYKLKIKIENPANLRNKKLPIWKDELIQADLDYQYYDDQIRILKDR